MHNRNYSPKIIAVALTLFAGWVTWKPSISALEAKLVSKRIQFERTVIPETAPVAGASVVLPFAEAFMPFAAYLTAFSPVGVSPGDLDGNGYPDELCIADPVRNRLTVLPSPGKPNPFLAFDVPLAPPPIEQDGQDAVRPTGCLFGDWNEDGRTDLLVYYWGRTPVLWLRNAESTELNQLGFTMREVVAPAVIWYTNSITQADLDGDGHLDLAVANYFPEDARIFAATHSGISEMNEAYGVANNGAANQIVLGTPHASMLFGKPSPQLSETEGTQWSLAIGAVDLSGDMLPEIYITNDHGPDRLHYNMSEPGSPKFRLVEGEARGMMTPPSKIIGRDRFHGMGLDFGDLNRDGFIDMFVSNVSVFHVLHENHFAWIHTGRDGDFAAGKAPFVDHAADLKIEKSGWSWDARLADFNNDGFLEVFQSLGFMRGSISRVPELHEISLGNDFFMRYPEVWHNFGPDDDLSGTGPNAFFVRRENGEYTDVGGLLGLTENGVSRGAATADFDGDGRLELIVGNHRAPVSVWQNIAPQVGAFVGFDLRLVYNPKDPGKISKVAGRVPATGGPAARPAVGARISFNRRDGSKFVGFVDGGSGFGGKKEPGVHAGLGGEAKADEIIDTEIAWRDSKGDLHTASVAVTPGWHTIFLGGARDQAEEAK